MALAKKIFPPSKYFHVDTSLGVRTFSPFVEKNMLEIRPRVCVLSCRGHSNRKSGRGKSAGGPAIAPSSLTTPSIHHASPPWEIVNTRVLVRPGARANNGWMFCNSTAIPKRSVGRSPGSRFQYVWFAGFLYVLLFRVQHVWDLHCQISLTAIAMYLYLVVSGRRAFISVG